MVIMKNFIAETSEPNTAESDLNAKVWHTVDAEDDEGNKYQTHIMASDPGDAIQRAQYRAPELWKKIEPS